MTATAIDAWLGGSSDPGRWWTRTNVSENTPEVLSPLCWSVWGENFEVAMRRCWSDIGILPAGAVGNPADPNERMISVFFGRQALNVDLCRSLVGSLPGSSAEDFDREVMGQLREGADPIATSYRRLPAILARVPGVVAKQSRLAARLHDDQLDWWRHEVFPPVNALKARALLEESARRFQQAMTIHLRSRFLVQMCQTQIHRLAGRAQAPELGLRISSGLGGVEETRMAQMLWAVARSETALDTFLSTYGFHGSGEGNLFRRSWREDPSALSKLIDGLGRRTDTDSPRRREEAATEARAVAEADLLGRVGIVDRRLARTLTKMAGVHVRNLERGKASFLMAIDGCRAAARALGGQLVEHGRLQDPEDAFFFTVPELLADPPGATHEVATARRATWEEYRSLEIPMIFVGEPSPSQAAPVTGSGGLTITGTSGSPGCFEGSARVVLDPGDAAELEPGEILVCRFTDPSWAPAFLLAQALVIDVGSPASHGAVVARELALPCVIGTGDGTSRIGTGDRLRVDGDTGTVTILSRSGQ